MRLLVLFTGGTIACTQTEATLSTDESKAKKLISLYQTHYEQETQFSSASPYTILSENLTAKALQKLGDALRASLEQSYDGIILTHGTDTLQYSLAAMCFHLPKPRLPIVFVSSNYVLEDERANGLINFAAAVHFLKQKPDAGIYTVYRNTDHCVYLHKGNLLLPHLPYSDDLYSIQNHFLARSAPGSYILQSPLISHENKADTATALPLPKNEASGLLWLPCYPGEQYASLSASTRAVLLSTYHSGTLCSDNPTLDSLLTQAQEREIPVFLTGAADGVSYESTKKWKHRITVLPDASPIAMYMKLWMLSDAYPLLQKADLIEWMQKNLCGEFLPPN